MGNIAPNGGRKKIIYYGCGRKRSRGKKMLPGNIKEPLLDLDKCSLNELINILQSFNDPYFNVHQTGFGSYIANYLYY
jgi:hypothetical protein